MSTRDADHEACAELLRRSGSSFALPIRMLPLEKRRGTTALYAFCRRADDIVDGSGDGPVDVAAATVELDAFEADVSAALSGARSVDPVVRALADTVERFAVPAEHLRAVIDGVRMDLGAVAIADVAALEAYCARVASAVGLAAMHVWGFSSSRAAEALAAGHACGLAFQMTNILRDVPEDLGRGRIYIPATDLAAAGCVRADLEEGSPSPSLSRLAALGTTRADGWFLRARRLDRLLSTDGRMVFRAMYGVYRTIFHEVRRRGATIFSRRVSAPKPLLAAAALVAVASGPRGIRRPW